MKLTLGDRLYYGGINVLMLVLCLLMLYPFMYVLAYSLSDSQTAMIRTITFYPVDFTLENYRVVLSNSTIYQSFFISVVRTLAGVLYALTLTALAAYAITKRNMPGNRIFALFLIIPMYISGGLLPSYVLIYNLNLFNNFLVYILPHGFWAFNMLIMRTFFDGIPKELDESARIDGAGEWKIFFGIYLPLSMPVIATISLFAGVFHWNSWFDAMLYVTKDNLMPMQYILQKMLNEALAVQMMAAEGNFHSLENAPTSAESIKMSTLIVSTLPIVLAYPFLQRYFVKGVMIGAVKG